MNAIKSLRAIPKICQNIVTAVVSSSSAAKGTALTADVVKLSKSRFELLPNALKLLNETEFRRNHFAQFLSDGKVILTQRSRGSKDLAEFLDWMRTGRFVKPQCPSIKFPPSAEAVKNSNQLAKNIIEANEHIVDGFRYQGPKAIFDASGKNVSRYFSGDAEKIIIDRAHDLTLQKTILAFKRRISSGNYSDEQKMRELMKFVDEIFSIEKSGTKIEKLVESFENMDKEFLMGDIIKSGAGVCRHKALMTKILGDEIGLGTRVVQGYYQNGGHAWNEVVLGDRTFLFDGALRQIFDISKKGNNLPLEVFKYKVDSSDGSRLVSRYLQEGSPIHYIYSKLTRKMPLKTAEGIISPTQNGYKFIPKAGAESGKIRINGIPTSCEVEIPKNAWIQTEKNGFQIP